jgi:TPR repeat protein
LSAGHASGAGGWLLTLDDLNRKLTITPGDAPGTTSDLLIQLAGSNGHVASELHTALKLSGTAEAHVGPTAPAPVRSAATPDEIRAWMSHGRDLERVGYLAGARLFFRRAAEGGSAVAAHALGETYDPVEFQKLDVHGMTPDPALAAKWYGRAKVLAAKPVAPQSRSGQ